MKKQILCVLLTLLVILSGCAPVSTGDKEGERLNIVATTYPVYLFACAVTDGVEGIGVERLNTGETSCLHDYTLSVSDMKKLELADVIALNGAELEEFMEDALHTSDAAVIDCSHGVELLENLSHHHVEEEYVDENHEEEQSHDGHDHGHWDPHYWMDIKNAVLMVENLVTELEKLDPEYAPVYRENGQKACLQLESCGKEMERLLRESAVKEIPGLITFHDGFQYFAHSYGLPLLEAIEEEAGSEASAKEIVEITNLVKAHGIPVIFTEVNGSDATAKAISRETDCRVMQLSMVMDGPDDELSNYCNGLLMNIKAVTDGFAGEEAAG